MKEILHIMHHVLKGSTVKPLNCKLHNVYVQHLQQQPDLNESDFIKKYGMGSAQLNRAEVYWLIAAS